MFVNNNGMNPMFMNNINEMNNNQPNLMDADALRIRNIILPYENKIKELEEVIRQKDFEIALLKDKLNNNGANFQNPNFMNLNQMKMIQQNSRKKISNKGQELIVTYESNVRNDSYSCFENEMAYKLFDKIYPDFEVNYNLYKFICDGKKLYPFLTIKENGLYNGCKIKNNPAINFIFKFNNNSTLIILDGDYPIKKAIKYYLLKTGKKGYFDQFIFLYNDKQLNIESKTPVKSMFGLNINPNIQVKYKNY